MQAAGGWRCIAPEAMFKHMSEHRALVEHKLPAPSGVLLCYLRKSYFSPALLRFVNYAMLDEMTADGGGRMVATMRQQHSEISVQLWLCNMRFSVLQSSKFVCLQNKMLFSTEH